MMARAGNAQSSAGGEPRRTLAVWCPDWPVMAAGAAAAAPAAVVHANRVVACTPAARAEGVRPGLRRREAQGRCPELQVLPHDPARDAREFEAVLAAVETLTPHLEVTRPGSTTFPCRGAVRYHGGETALARLIATAVNEVLGPRGHCRIGIANGRFAAELAARQPTAAAAGADATEGVESGADSGDRAADVGAAERVGVDADGGDRAVGAGDTGSVGVATESPDASEGAVLTTESGGELGLSVPPGQTPAFLARLPVSVLGDPELADLLIRLGLRTLGAVASLPLDTLSARFGAQGVRAHRLASGDDGLPRPPRQPPADLTAEAALDPPAERVDVAAFTARSLAAELAARLAALGLACTRIRIEAVTEHGEQLVRHWRADGAFTEAAAAERVRWQLDGWLSSAAADRPTAGIALLRLTADEATPDQGHQLTLWGGPTTDDERAGRALARVQGLLGHDAVTMPVVQGGRVPGDRAALVARGGPEPAAAAAPAVTIPHPRAARYAAARAAHPAGTASRPAAAVTRNPEAPWPGRVPAPAPATVHTDPPPAELLDTDGEVVAVDGRGHPRAAPARLWFGQGPWATVAAWAGPWPADERWWDPAQHRRSDRVQVATLDGRAYLLALVDGHWWLEATYD